MEDFNTYLQSFLDKLKYEKGIKEKLPTVHEIRTDYNTAVNFFNKIVKPLYKDRTYNDFQEDFGTPTLRKTKTGIDYLDANSAEPKYEFPIHKVSSDAIQGTTQQYHYYSERPMEKISLQVYANVVTFPHKIEVIVLLALLLLGILYKNKVGAIYHNRLKPIAIGFKRGAKKYKGIVLASVLAVLLLTNPSINDFYDYMGVNRNNYHAHLQRKINLLFISLYTDKYGNEYLGLLGNFIPL